MNPSAAIPSTGAVTRLADIDPPVPPSPVAPTVTVVLALVLALTCLLLWRRHLERGRACRDAPTPLRTLEELERRQAAGRIDGRTLAYELASLLRHHYRLPALDHTPPDPCPIDGRDWGHLIDWLDRARYARVRPDSDPGACSLVRRCLAPIDDA